MAENLDILNAAVSLLVRAALLAARFSGRVRQRSLKRLAARDTDAKAKEILFLKNRIYQLEMQLSILHKQLTKKGKKPRYEVRERLLILWHIEAFQIPRRKICRYFGIARSTLYRWLHQIEDQKPTDAPANKTPTEIASLVWEITRANLSWGRIRIANQLKLLGTTCTTIAPTGSISIIARCSSGIEPIFQYAYQRRALDGSEFVRLHPLLARIGRQQGWLTDEVKAELMAGADPKDVRQIPRSLSEVLVTAHEIAPEWHVAMQAALQASVDNAVSKTVNLPSSATVEDVDRVFRLPSQQVTIARSPPSPLGRYFATSVPHVSSSGGAFAANSAHSRWSRRRWTGAGGPIPAPRRLPEQKCGGWRAKTKLFSPAKHCESSGGNL
jgi:transposase-like protein